MSKNRRKFTLDYKVEAAHRVIDTGRTSTEVAQELSINEASLRAWVRGKKTN
jgi:transposase